MRALTVCHKRDKKINPALLLFGSERRENVLFAGGCAVVQPVRKGTILRVAELDLFVMVGKTLDAKTNLFDPLELQILGDPNAEA